MNNLSTLAFLFSEPIVIIFPEDLRTDQNGFDFFSELLKKTSFKNIYHLDLSKLIRIEANLYAILGAVIKSNEKNGAKFRFVNVFAPFVKESLIENEFIKKPKDYINKGHYQLDFAVPFREFSMKDESVVEEYIYKYVLLSKRMPKMSQRAKKKIFRSIFEVYQNSVMHSGAESVFVCGHYYNLKRRLELTMVEIGVSFKQRIRNHSSDYENMTGAECIDWATISGNTTKEVSETGGLGLDLIREFLKLNNGKLQIRSADGYWEEKKGSKFVENCNYEFTGSIVNMEFNLYDTKTYYIQGEEIDDVKDIL